MNEFMRELLGDAPLPKFAAAVVMALIGAFLSLLLQTTKRDPLSPNTPFKWSWSFLWSDNAKRVVSTIILILIFVRFSQEFFGANATVWLGLLIGLGNDKLSQLLKDKGVFGSRHTTPPRS